MKVFISHSSKDKRFVRKLKDDLNENSISTWFDEDQLKVGDSLLEKLEDSLEDSTHFMIILSPHSVKSQWVKYELENAIKINQKIIPIKYQDCKIPPELKKYLYVDLSNEIVEIKGDIVEFTTKGYQKQLTKLIKDLRSSKFKLTDKDRTKIQTPVENKNKKLIRVNIEVIGFSVKGKKRFINKLKDKDITTKVPVVLPPIAKSMNLKIGDTLTIDNGTEKIETHFAGYRRYDLKIVLPSKVKQKLGISYKSIYAFQFNSADKSISLLEE